MPGRLECDPYPTFFVLEHLGQIWDETRQTGTDESQVERIAVD